MDIYFIIGALLALLAIIVISIVWWHDPSWVDADEVGVGIAAIALFSVVWPISLLIAAFFGATHGIAALMNIRAKNFNRKSSP